MNKVRVRSRMVLLGIMALCWGPIGLWLGIDFIKTALPFGGVGSYVRFALGISFCGTAAIMFLAGIGMIVGIVRQPPKS